MRPSTYTPTEPDHFIGPARQAADIVTRLVTVAKTDKSPLRLIFTGMPGIGKTRLADLTTRLLGANKWSTHKLNGTQVKVEEIEEIARSLVYRDMFGGWRVIQIEEIDKMPAVARSRLLTFCDDMPSETALIATTNLTAEQMRQENPATKRRYSWIELDPPKPDEIYAFLRAHWPDLPEPLVKHTSVMCCGSVGDALQELDPYYAMAA